MKRKRPVEEDWEQCLVAMQLFRDMGNLGDKRLLPISCYVSDLERSAVESQKDDDKWLFVEANPSQN